MLSRGTRSFQQLRKMSIKGALIDLSGTLHVEDEPTPNAVEALKRCLVKTKIFVIIFIIVVQIA